MKKRTRSIWIWLVISFLLVCAPVAAQGQATVSGTITGPDSRPLSNIPVYLYWEGGWRDLRTDGAGHYSAQVPRGIRLEFNVIPQVELRLAQRGCMQEVNGDLVKDFALVHGHLLSGRVLLPGGQPPSDELWLSAMPFTIPLPEQEWLGDAALPPQGTFQMVLPPDVYLLRLDSPPAPYYSPMDRVDLRNTDLMDYTLTLSSTRPPAVPSSPPVASRIHVDAPDPTGMAIVRGDAGATLPLASLFVVALDIDRPVVAVSSADGSFRTTLFAPRGTCVMIKQGYDPWRAHWAANYYGNSAGDESDVTPWPSTTVLSPIADTNPADGIDFGTSGVVTGGGVGLWTASGTQGPLRGNTLPIRGTLRIISTGITASTDPGAIRVNGGAFLRPVSRADGRPVSVDQSFMSDLLTPTGLPIERFLTVSSDPSTGFSLTSWQHAPGDPHALEGQFSFSFRLPDGLQAGYYHPVLHFNVVSGLPPAPNFFTTRNNYFLRWWDEGWLPVFKYGSPSTPRLIWTLLMDELSSGSRGIVAREDAARFNISAHIITQAERFIVERLDPQTGRPRVYRLEPYLPMISFSDRGVPNQPAVTFRFPSGQLQVQVKRPSGVIDTLGPAPFAQSTSRTPCNLDGNIYEQGTGHLDDVYQLTTLNDAFAYTFREYGHHVITMTGQLQDIFGNTWSGGGTYDIYAARTLTFDAGSVPASPYVVGDVFNPKVQVHPGMAADIQVRVRMYPNSDAGHMTTQTVSGRANRCGFFDGKTTQPLRFTTQGEYRIDLTGTYTDTNGTLWMGSVTWANVVEPSVAQIIAHGRRGLDTIADVNQRLPWFFHRTQPVIGTTHSYYPYFSGDILWGQDREAWWGGDAIKPIASFQDPDGRATQLLRQRVGATQGEIEGPGDFDQRAAVNEVPLLSSTSSGKDPALAPQDVDQWAYAYRSSERPGLHVHDDVSEDMMSTGYWRFNDNYGHQIGVGVLGDLPNDIKWQYVGVVFRNAKQNVFRYGAYASLWVLAPDSDPMGARTMPPFQGATGGPSGGPIMTLKGKAIDLFFLPMGVGPGSVLQVGQNCSFSGQVGPPLASRLAVTITSPSRVVHGVQGRADKVGYFYDPTRDFAVNEPGRWTVDVSVVHDGQTSAGPAVAPYPHGDVLGSAAGRFEFYVVPAGEPPLIVQWPPNEFLTLRSRPLPALVLSIGVPPDWRDTLAYYTITMPGFILKQGQVMPEGGSLRVAYDPETLARDFPNLDLVARDEQRPGLADLVTISLLASGHDAQGAPAHRACVTTLLAEEVQNTRIEQPYRACLPVIVRR